MEVQHRVRGVCVCPPALDDLALITAIDGDADASILEHLRLCPFCAERARDFGNLQTILRQRLYRILCPLSDDLAAYQQGWCTPQRHAEISAHLRECPHCAREYHMLSEFTSPPAPPLVSQLRRIKAVPIGGPRRSAAAYGGMRGAGNQYAYRAENLELTIDVQRAASRPERVVLVGMLLNDGGVESDPSRATASLLADDTVVGSAVLDELGSFVLEDIVPGDYSLSLRLPDFEVVVEALAL